MAPQNGSTLALGQTRTWPQLKIGGLLGYAAIWAFFGVFLIYPLIRLFFDAVTTETGAFTLQNFYDFFTDSFYLKTLWNSILLGLGTVVTTSIIGITFAFLLLRYDFPGRSLFSYLSFVPMIMPPLVGVMGFVFIMGRAGTVNIILMDYFGMAKPINFMYGIQGVLLVETLHLFPLMTLSIVDAMGKISPSLDEAAESVGSRGLRKFWDITFPLTTPGYVSGALLVFIWTFADFATPLVVGVDDLLASQAYLNIVQFVDRRLFKMGIVISAIMVILAILFLIVAKKYVSIKDYSSLSYSVIERKKLTLAGKIGVIFFLAVILLMAFIPYLGIALDSFGKGWALTPFPVKYTLQYFQRVAIETPKFILNSLLYSGISVIICIAVGVPVAWVLARTKLPGREFLDSLTTLILALPGTGIGIAYLRAFREPLPFMSTALIGMWIVIPIVLGVRRLPYTVRGTFASLLIVHKSFEEAAESVGAPKMKTFKDVTLPLIWKGVLVGSLYSFILALQEASATLLLVVPGHEMMTVGIFNFYIGGSINEAAALGLILILLGAACLFVITKVAGTKMGGVFG
ncbi:MAG: iron ABC transporter permease [Deltaproteobacteria bacterium]|nr:iron ABC transporter permease [Deltaproteobacteria bacterium]NTV57222.1 iron ABC transporter permease [Deltaproteobacteria bacterium]